MNQQTAKNDKPEKKNPGGKNPLFDQQLDHLRSI